MLRIGHSYYTFNGSRQSDVMAYFKQAGVPLRALGILVLDAFHISFQI